MDDTRKSILKLKVNIYKCHSKKTHAEAEQKHLRLHLIKWA